MVFEKGRAFSLIELIFVIGIIAVLALIAIPFFYDIHGDAEQAAEEGVVGAVRSGIGNYGAESEVTGRTPLYPLVLDSSSNGDASPSNPLFGYILENGITIEWIKDSDDHYTGPACNTYIYDNIAGTFNMTGALLATYNFDGGAHGWSTSGSNIQVVGDQYAFGVPGGWGGQNRALAGDESWTDYTIEVDATLHQGWGYGIYFRVQDVENPAGPNGYIFQ